MNPINRRDVLKWSAFLAGSALLPRGLFAAGENDRPRKILFFTKSADFQHDMTKRKGTRLGFAEQTLIDLGKQHNLEVTVTKDGRIFDDPKFAEFDAIVFYTTGDLTKYGNENQSPMSPAGKQALLDTIHGGKGFVGIHCASDTFHSASDANPDPYIQMLGGEFIVHGKQQKSTSHIAGAGFPGSPAQGDFTLHEEWYSLKNFADDLHVILVQETKGMTGLMYQRPPYPSTWARRHGSGRVFYTSMGHRQDMWTNPIFQNLLLAGIAWTAGTIEADVTPNLDKVAPGAHTLPPTTAPAKVSAAK